ncbi:MAG: hypothetical protein QG641_496, partial [Candidatus Poribacteria bacterium]|nr:hypothetical protein [Candidatus Poribacteria bacterium]
GNISQPYIELSDELLIEALQNGVELALSYLSNQERRILALKFDAEWTLRSISEQCDKLGLEKMTEKQVGHAIDSILRKMLPMINRALADIDDADIKLPALKQILLEWGTQG